MFAVVQTGGKQYRVTPGQSLLVEKILGEDGSDITIDRVLCLGSGSNIHVGSPLVKGAKVILELVRQVRGEKVIIFKKNRRHNYRRKKGHRQSLSLLKVKDIMLADQSIVA